MKDQIQGNENGSFTFHIFKLPQGDSMGTNCWMVGRLVVGKKVKNISKQRRLSELIVHLRLFFYKTELQFH
jgi:hypothetical protein